MEDNVVSPQVKTAVMRGILAATQNKQHIIVLSRLLMHGLVYNLIQNNNAVNALLTNEKVQDLKNPSKQKNRRANNVARIAWTTLMKNNKNLRDRIIGYIQTVSQNNPQVILFVINYYGGVSVNNADKFYESCAAAVRGVQELSNEVAQAFNQTAQGIKV
jgi:hypothetical protein